MLNSQLVGSHCVTQGPQPGALWPPRGGGWGVGGRLRKEGIHVFLPGKFHGQRSLAGYSPWGHKESDMTEYLTLSHG